MAGGFTFLGVHSSNYNITVTEISLPISPEPRLRLQDVPGRPGAYSFGAELGARYVKMKCTFHAISLSSLWDLALQVALWLNVYREGPLILDELPGKYLTVRVSKGIDPAYAVSHGKFDLEFVAAEPFFYKTPDDVFLFGVGDYTANEYVFDTQSDWQTKWWLSQGPVWDTTTYPGSAGLLEGLTGISQHITLDQCKFEQSKVKGTIRFKGFGAGLGCFISVMAYIEGAVHTVWLFYGDDSLIGVDPVEQEFSWLRGSHDSTDIFLTLIRYQASSPEILVHYLKVEDYVSLSSLMVNTYDTELDWLVGDMANIHITVDEKIEISDPANPPGTWTSPELDVNNTSKFKVDLVKTVPANTSVTIQYRTYDDSWSPWVAATEGSEYDISLKTKFQVKLILSNTDNLSTPQVDKCTITRLQPFVFTQDGTATTNPLYRLKGVSAGGTDKFKIQVNNKGWVAFSGALTAGQKLQLDIDKLTASVINSGDVFVSNALGNITGDLTLLKVDKGTVNLQIATEGAATWDNLYLLSRARWY